jgi:hypothetical protein
LVTENSKAAIDFDGVDDYLTASNLLTELDNTDFLISAVSADEFSAGSEASVPRLYLRHRAWSYNTLDTMTWSPLTGQSLLSFQVDGATQEVFGNGTSLATASEAQVDFTPTDFQVGRYASTGWMDGTLQEIIIFNSDQSTNRTGIEGNIGRYYNIDGFRDVFVSKWFDQSGNFNHAENSTSTEQPQIVDGGSVITEGTTPKAALDFDGVDDSFTANALAGLSRLDLFFATQTSDTIYIHFNEVGNLTDRGFTAQDGSTSSGLSANMGTPTMYNNGTQFTGTTRDDVHTAQDGHQVISYIDADTTAFLTFEIGGHGSFVFDGKFQELIAFDSDQSTNRTDIENNINKHFKIYE